MVGDLTQSHVDATEEVTRGELWRWFMQFMVEAEEGSRNVFGRHPCYPPAVVVLSGASIQSEDGSWIEGSPENRARVEKGARLAHTLQVPLILCGEAEQLQAMEAIASEWCVRYAPGPLVKCCDAGPRGPAVNTKTQIEQVCDMFGEDARRLYWVTSAYHAPRVYLTVLKVCVLDHPTVHPVPYSRDRPYDIAKRVDGEIRRILKYSATGDIASPENLPDFYPFAP